MSGVSEMTALSYHLRSRAIKDKGLSLPSTTTSPYRLTEKICRRFDADSPLSSVLSWAVSSSNSDDGDAPEPYIVDVTVHPPRVISSPQEGPSTTRRETYDPEATTLQSCGWFPTGRLAVLRGLRGDDGDAAALEFVRVASSFAVDVNESFAWRGGGGCGTVAAARSGPKPSEVLSAADGRFDGDDLGAADVVSVACAARENVRRERVRNLERRNRKLDANIQKLEKKEGAVNSQVRKMLIKDRATGDVRVRMEDRFYLEVMVEQANDEGGDEGGKEVPPSIQMFFSRMTSAGKIAASARRIFPAADDEHFSEVLVRHPSEESADSSSKRFGRLSNTICLFELETAGVLQQFNMVVVRYFLTEGERTDPISLESIKGTTGFEPIEDIAKVTSQKDDEQPSDAMEPSEQYESSQPNEDALFHDEELDRMLADFDATQRNKKKSTARRKKKPPSRQVRRMLMRSSAVGDRRIAEADRFHLEVVAVVRGAAGTPAAVVGKEHFFSQSCTCERVVYAAIAGAGLSVPACEVLAVVENEGGVGDAASPSWHYRRLAPGLKLSEAQKANLLEECDRIVVRTC